jgi:uncharacterized phage protein (TIGR02220 family)
MAELPYIKLYPGDWERDANCLTAMAEFALFKLIPKFNDAKNKGVFMAHLDTLCVLFKSDLATVKRVINELKRNNTLDIFELEDDCFEFKNRRVLREKALSETRSDVGKQGGRGHKKANEKLMKSKRKPKQKQNPEYEYDSEIESVVKYLNEKASTNFKTETKITKEFITARIKDGYTVEQFKIVIDNKTKDWLTKPDMVKYLRPETLFGNKFDGYLNQVDAISETQIGKAQTAVDSTVGFLERRHGTQFTGN